MKTKSQTASLEHARNELINLLACDGWTLEREKGNNGCCAWIGPRVHQAIADIDTAILNAGLGADPLLNRIHEGSLVKILISDLKPELQDDFRSAADECAEGEDLVVGAFLPQNDFFVEEM